MVTVPDHITDGWLTSETTQISIEKGPEERPRSERKNSFSPCLLVP